MKYSTKAVSLASFALEWNKKWINAKHSSSLSIDVIQIFIFVFFFSETVFWSVFVSFLFFPPFVCGAFSASLDVVCLCFSDGSPWHAFTSQLFIITKEVMATAWTRMDEQRQQTNDRRRRRRKKIYQLINWKRSFFCAVCLILKMCPITHSPRPLMPTNENLFSFPFLSVVTAKHRRWHRAQMHQFLCRIEWKSKLKVTLLLPMATRPL